MSTTVRQWHLYMLTGQVQLLQLSYLQVFGFFWPHKWAFLSILRDSGILPQSTHAINVRKWTLNCIGLCGSDNFINYTPEHQTLLWRSTEGPEGVLLIGYLAVMLTHQLPIKVFIYKHGVIDYIQLCRSVLSALCELTISSSQQNPKLEE